MGIKRFAGRNKGFSLVELLMYMMIFGIASTAMYTLFISNSKSHSSQENTMEMTQDLRGAADLLTREIRMAGFDPTEVGGVGFVSNTTDEYDTNSDSIHFTMDYDEDGALTGTNENINYYLYTADGIQKLGRRTGGTGNPNPVAEYVTALSFVYYNSGGTQITPGGGNPAFTAMNLANIRSVQISITTETPNPDAITGQKKTRTMTSRVRIRNL
jgi:type IV pilus assembly protein PilW